MLEAGLVVVGVALAALLALVPGAVTASLAIGVGISTLLVGLLVGLSSGLWYHVLLYRALAPRLRMPRRWWLSPARLHAQLTDAERLHIRPWYQVGGLGFALCVAGGVVAIAASLLAPG